MKSFLNVGGGLRTNPVPPYFQGWKHDLLDIDPQANPDVCMDARELHKLPGGTYDAVLCSHNLEHYFLHDAVKVVQGFLHVLKPDGFVHVKVPDIGAVIKHAAANNLDMDDILYMAPVGPILVRDILYGYQKQIRESGVEFFAHKNGFTFKSLVALFSATGWVHMVHGTDQAFELWAIVFKQLPTAEQKAMLSIQQLYQNQPIGSGT